MTVQIPQFDRAPRHDGWTAERKTRFLDSLAEKGNVRHACSRVRLSQQSAYLLRRRDAEFARAWAAALALAREHVAQVLAERAIDGVEEPVWYRGELVGTRRKYDTRLLLAHLARLDKLVDENATWADAGRFDELLAAMAGEYVPELIASDHGGLLPLDRESAAQRAANEAELAVRHAERDDADECQEHGEPDSAGARENACIEAFREGHARAARRWDSWFEDACGFVDFAAGRLDEPAAPGLPGGDPLDAGDEGLPAHLREKLAAVAAEVSGTDGARDSSSCTHSTYSTSALAAALAGPAKGFDFTPKSPFASVRA
jgi:hypothetical protein